MSLLNNLQKTVAKRKRVGRGNGSGMGKTCGLGHKGNKARSGYSPGSGYFEGGQISLFRRIPKSGFTKYNKTTIGIPSSAILDLKGDITVTMLKQLKLVPKYTKKVKVYLSDKKPINCSPGIDVKFTDGVRKQII